MLTWEDALGQCSSEGGTLAKISREGLRYAFTDLLEEMRPKPEQLHFGLFAQDSWVWIDGSPFSDSLWLSGYPSAYHGIQSCAVLSAGSKKIKNWLYIDDVLASGGTFRIDIENEIENYGVEKFLDSNIRIIGLFFILHSWGLSNTKFVLSKKFGNEIKKHLKYYRVAEIDNNPHVNYYHPNPKFNHIYPIESDQGKEFLKFIEEAFERSYEMRNEKFAFRNPDFPKTEKFYSSKEDRIRYENIILDKGIQIINSIDNLCAQSLRPLGMAPPSFKTLGTGSHFFTWRNISNTCPLVYWWGANNWHPLFPVQNRGLK